jgi:hypothetical protein
MNQFGSLVPDCLNDLPVTMSGRIHGYARRKIQEPVAVDIPDPHSPGAVDDQRIDPGVGWRNEHGIGADKFRSLRPWQGRFYKRGFHISLGSPYERTLFRLLLSTPAPQGFPDRRKNDE